LEHAKFREKLDGIEDTPAPDHAFDPEENACRYLMGYEFFSLMKNGMTRIRTAVVAKYVGVVARLTKMVGNLAFPAISVLEIDDNVNRLSGHNCLNLTKKHLCGKREYGRTRPA
jgi:hypothetical protein